MVSAMKPPHVAGLSALLVLGLLAGCATPRAARIREHAAIYEALDPFSKKLVDDGLFDLGFSAEAAYMALGRPTA